jgi:hypothetical protein
MHCSSIWIHKVAVYDIMAISWGAQTKGLIVVGGRVDKGIYNLLHYGQFHSPTFMAHHVHRLLSWNFSTRKANLGRDNTALLTCIRSLRIEIDHANAHVQSKITSKNSQKNCTKTLLQWNENTFLHWRHTFTPKDIQMHQQSLDHSYTANEKPR